MSERRRKKFDRSTWCQKWKNNINEEEISKHTHRYTRAHAQKHRYCRYCERGREKKEPEKERQNKRDRETEKEREKDKERVEKCPREGRGKVDTQLGEEVAKEAVKERGRETRTYKKKERDRQRDRGMRDREEREKRT